MKKWVVYNKKADFKAIGRQFHIDQVTARILRNRDLTDYDDIRKFLSGNTDDFHDPHLLKDADLLTDLLKQKILEKKPIRVIGDYDIDGVMSTFILVTALRKLHAEVSWQIPDRIIDGYGLNRNLIEKAHTDGIDTILTCDNGIAALEEIALAKSMGMTILVTDHHEIPFEIVNGVRMEKTSLADAVVNAHQNACQYPNKDLCGGSCAWKVVCILYEKFSLPQSEADRLLEFAAFATVGDIMSLTGENRILVKEGLKRMHHTWNIGLRALSAQCGLELSEINAYHLGFVLGPCINATGRLDTAARALELLFSEDMAAAVPIAAELVALNRDRKEMTAKGVELACELCETEEYASDRVLILYLPGVHESIAGIIAGRVRERYYKPTFVITDGANGLKGSGRSIETYSMYEELCKCSEYLTRFGGHPMAAGISLLPENLAVFREKMNAFCTLTPEDLIQKVRIDVPMPVDYVTMDLVREFSLLEPYGKDNPRPVFADRGFHIRRMWTIGKTTNYLRFQMISQNGQPISVLYFGDYDGFLQFLSEKFGSDQVKRAFCGETNSIVLSMVYEPSINSFRGNESLQFEMKEFC